MGVIHRGAHEPFATLTAGVTVPFHKGRDISPVLLRKIAQDIRISAEGFIAVKR